MKTSFDLPTVLRDAMDQARTGEGYTVKRKSQWICEAIVGLPKHDPQLRAVGVAEDLDKRDTKCSVNLTGEAEEVIRKARSTIRRGDPEAEGLTGQIIRAAIRLRLQRLSLSSVAGQNGA